MQKEEHTINQALQNVYSDPAPQATEVKGVTSRRPSSDSSINRAESEKNCHNGKNYDY